MVSTSLGIIRSTSSMTAYPSLPRASKKAKLILYAMVACWVAVMIPSQKSRTASGSVYKANKWGGRRSGSGSRPTHRTDDFCSRSWLRRVLKGSFTDVWRCGKGPLISVNIAHPEGFRAVRVNTVHLLGNCPYLAVGEGPSRIRSRYRQAVGWSDNAVTIIPWESTRSSSRIFPTGIRL